MGKMEEARLDANGSKCRSSESAGGGNAEAYSNDEKERKKRRHHHRKKRHRHEDKSESDDSESRHRHRRKKKRKHHHKRRRRRENSESNVECDDKKDVDCEHDGSEQEQTEKSPILDAVVDCNGEPAISNVQESGDVTKASPENSPKVDDTSAGAGTGARKMAGFLPAKLSLPKAVINPMPKEEDDLWNDTVTGVSLEDLQPNGHLCTEGADTSASPTIDSRDTEECATGSPASKLSRKQGNSRTSREKGERKRKARSCSCDSGSSAHSCQSSDSFHRQRKRVRHGCSDSGSCSCSPSVSPSDRYKSSRAKDSCLHSDRHSSRYRSSRSHRSRSWTRSPSYNRRRSSSHYGSKIDHTSRSPGRYSARSPRRHRPRSPSPRSLTRSSSRRYRSRSPRRYRSRSPRRYRSRSPRRYRSRSPPRYRSRSPRRYRSRSPRRRFSRSPKRYRSRSPRRGSRYRSRSPRSRRSVSPSPVSTILPTSLPAVPLYGLPAGAVLPGLGMPQQNQAIVPPASTASKPALNRFTALCTKISNKKSDDEAGSDDETNRPVRHPFAAPKVDDLSKIKAVPSNRRQDTDSAPGIPAITSGQGQSSQQVNISEIVLQLKAREPAALLQSFPVSTGIKHQKAEDNPEANNVAASGAAPTGRPVPRPAKPELDTGIVARRMALQQCLAANPQDFEAMSALAAVQAEVAQFCASASIYQSQQHEEDTIQPLAKAELEAGTPAWAKKDMFSNLNPVREGFGSRMLRKLGWSHGQPLGKSGDGSAEPVPITFKSDRKGLSSQGEGPGRKSSTLSALTKPNVPVVSGGKNNSLALASLTGQGKHPVSVLMEHCSRMRWPAPEYVLAVESGPQHNKLFQFKVCIQGTDYTSATSMNNKKQAKAAAALAAVQALGLQ